MSHDRAHLTRRDAVRGACLQPLTCVQCHKYPSSCITGCHAHTQACLLGRFQSPPCRDLLLDLAWEFGGRLPPKVVAAMNADGSAASNTSAGSTAAAGGAAAAGAGGQGTAEQVMSYVRRCLQHEVRARACYDVIAALIMAANNPAPRPAPAAAGRRVMHGNGVDGGPSGGAVHGDGMVGHTGEGGDRGRRLHRAAREMQGPGGRAEGLQREGAQEQQHKQSPSFLRRRGA